MKKQCYIYMNCFGKVLRDYLLEIPDFASAYTTTVFYVMDSVTTVDIDLIKVCDLFLYQDISAVALKSTDPNTDLTQYTTDYIVSCLLSHGCRKISVPSVYFSGYFYDGIPQSKLPEHIKSQKTLSGKPCADYFPNYCFNAQLLRLAMEPGIPALQIVRTLSNPALYDKSLVLKNLETTLNNLKERETRNKVDIPLTEFIRTNFRKKRLFHTTNHPTIVIFEHVINRIFELLGLTTRTTLNKDLMERQARVPILPCVLEALGIPEHTNTFGGPFYVQTKKIDTFEDYVGEYVTILKSMNLFTQQTL